MFYGNIKTIVKKGKGTYNLNNENLQIHITVSFNKYYNNYISCNLQKAVYIFCFCIELEREELSSLIVSMCGLLSGVLASFLTHPADVVKTAIQSSTEPYRNVETVQNIFKVTAFRQMF